jgi:serine protease Do
MVKYLIVIFIFLIISPINSEELKRLFKEIESSIYVIKIIDKQADEKISYGSGFSIADNGYIITNYHVIASAITFYKNTDIIIQNNKGVKFSAELINFNISKDLALLKIDTITKNHIKYNVKKINQGEKIYSIGNPKEIRVIIEEGIYNDLLSNSIEERIIFYGNINEGMSCDPSVDKNKNLIGVNVSGYGDGVSFLVPAIYAWNLYENRNEGKIDFKKELFNQIYNIDKKTTELIINSKTEEKIFFNKKFNVLNNDILSCWSDTHDNNENLDINIIFENVCGIKTLYYINNNLSYYPFMFRYGFVQKETKYIFLDIMKKNQNCNIDILRSNKK